MSEVDDRIVSIQFDNRSFERRIEQTLRSLDKLSESLQFSNAGKGIERASTALNSFNTDHMGQAIDHIASRFTSMGAVAFSVINNLTTGVLRFTRRIGGDILAPIIGGGTSRAKNLEQAAFLFEGIGINVKEGMDAALKAVKGTAFGLDEAAKIAAQFGASGLKAGEEMSTALRGVAGVAALTGSSFGEIGDIFVSSAGMNEVNRQDLMQFATRGLNAASALAKQLGVTEEKVNEMASNGEIDFKTFAKAMDDAFGEHATSANKTYSGSLANMRAAFSRLGAQFATPHLQQQRDLFNALTPVIDNVAEGLKPLIDAFVLLKRINVDNLIEFIKGINVTFFQFGIQLFVDGLVNLYHALKPIAKVFKGAFKDIFSGSAGKNFVELAESFKEFTERIKIGADTLNSLKSIFRGFFAAVEIGFEIVKGVVRTIGDVLQALLPAGKGLLGFGENTGDFITNLNKALVEGGGIKRFFEDLSAILINPVEAFKKLKNAIVDFFEGVNFSSDGPIKALQDLRDKIFNFFNINIGNKVEVGLGRVGQRMEQVHSIWDRVQSAFAKVNDFLQPVLDYMTDWFKSLGDKIAEAFQPGDFNAALDVINVGLLAGIAVLIKKFVDGGFGGLNILSGGFINRLNGLLDTVNEKFQAMQIKLKAEALMKIAAAIAIIAGALLVLSLIDSKALTKALVALSVSFGQLLGALALIGKFDLGAHALRLQLVATAMILIASAAVVLAVAIKILSTMKLGDLAKGLGGVAVGLGLLVVAVNSISANTAGMISAGIALIIISTSLIILSQAVKQFAQMSMGELAKGMGAIAFALALLVTSLNKISANTTGLVSAAIAIALISTSLIILNRAIRLFASMSLGEMAKGFLGVAAALTTLIVAMNFILTNSAGLIAAGIAMIAIGIAMNIMASAIEKMGGLAIGTLAKGIGALAAILLVLVVATNLMQGAAGGAFSILIVAVALRILAKVLKSLGELSIAQLAMGLGAIAGVLAVLGIAAALLSPVIPNILALGAALSLLGVAFALFGVGAALIAKAFEIMANSGAAGAKGIVEALKIIITAMPNIQKALFDFAIGFAKDILKAAPLLLRLFQAFVMQLLETVIDLAPKMAEAAIVVIQSFLLGVREIFPDVVQTGIEMLLVFLQGVRDNIGEIATAASDIMINFMDAIRLKLPEIATSAASLIVAFLNELGNHAEDVVAAGLGLLVNVLKGISDNVSRVVGAVSEIITEFITAMGTHAVKVIGAGVKVLTDFLKGIGDNLVKIVATVGEVITRFITEIGNQAHKIVTSGADSIIKFFNGLASKAPKVIGALAAAITAVLTSVASEIGKQVPIIVAAGFDMLIALFNGMANAIDSRDEELGRAIGRFAGSLAKAFRTIFVEAAKQAAKDAVPVPDLLGPEREVLPGPRPEPAPPGNIDAIFTTASFTDETPAIDKFVTALAQVPAILEGMDEFNPTITPVLDLTNIETASGDIATLMSIPILTPEVSFDQARAISSTNPEVGEETGTGESTVINNTFEQTINSPEPLSTNDIYRNTKSQFALAKEKLSIS